MTKSPRHSSYEQIDPRHPFRRFLDELPEHPGCDPRPDWIERGTSYRYVIAFSSLNGNARMKEFRAQLNMRKPEASVMQESFGSHSARCIIYITPVRTLNGDGSIGMVPAEEELPPFMRGAQQTTNASMSTSLVLVKKDEAPKQPEPELEGIEQMPSYSR